MLLAQCWPLISPSQTGWRTESSLAGWCRCPIHEDEDGRLYEIGRRKAPSAFFAVRDHVLDVDGASLDHRIAVPSHLATARETVA